MGKVHGSLARAGKVKSATPKASAPAPPCSRSLPQSPFNRVEPQEKKKTPKGRAYKRILYTRRFVNVTMTGGKRKVHTPQPTT
ncbi:40S ribosomal protein S30-A [Penicillium lagena]|uniref:40S ribosomal protein S30-A n=1 Tax=Penicillium lagena TaxID=94218 RepID=UPI0025410B5E|nr:40S ribosomal protein S30-A [Penicillium lagena]KAJ5605569.1 40S ribosomal protein S30-A [Penicillium lagena]